MSSLLSLIHLSDIHLREFGNTIMSRLDALVAGICEADQRCRNFIVVLSGDIAYAGSAAEYNIASHLVAAITAGISRLRPGSLVHWLAVPRNHDCVLPEPEEQLRSVLVEGILPTLRDNPNSAILEQLLQKQADYFQFSRDLFHFPINEIERLCGVRVLTIQGKRLVFALYNTALLSRRNEKQGLALPIQTIRSTIDLAVECDLRISIFHHPYFWLDPNDSITFRDHIDMSSEIVLTGHQHVPYGFAKQNLSGETVLYLEGHVLQEESNHAQSGFRAIVLDLEEGVYKVISYSWKKSFYESCAESDYKPLLRLTSRTTYPTPSQEFLARLSDSGIGLTHSAMGPLSLDTLYVYPDVVLRKAAAFELQRHLSGESLLQYVSTAPKVMITGSARAGKSALAKTLSREWLRARQFYPLLISGKSIRSAQASYFEELVDRECALAYGPADAVKYRRLPLAAKVLLVDDWDESPLKVEAQSSLLKLASLYFGKIVLLSGSITFIDHLIYRLHSEDELFAYDFLAIQQLSFVARGQIIDKWMSLEFSPSSQEFGRKVEEAERLIDTIIGKNTLPALPFIVIAILEASQRNREILPDNGSFGYLYEVLITGALNTTLSKNSQLDRKYQFLSLLAFRLFNEHSEILSVNSVKHMLDEYAKDWIIKLDEDALLADLEYAHILVRRDGHYTFAYAHLFHYFLARHFKSRLYGQGPEKDQARKVVLDIVKGLNVGSNSIFLMFIIYLTNDQLLTDELVRISDRVLSEYSPSTFERRSTSTT